MILEKRNRKVQITESRLKQIILEEYVKEEGVVGEAMSQEKADEFIAWINKKGPKPEWLERDYGPGSYKRGKQTPAYDSNVDRSAETMPLSADDMPQYNDVPDEEGAYDVEAEAPAGFSDTQEMNVREQVIELVQDMPGEEIMDLLTSVLEQLAPEFVKPPRRKIGFEIEEIKDMIKEAFDDYQDFEAAYDVMKGEGPPRTKTPPESAPSDYENLMTAYHALEDAVKHHPDLQSALDNVANILDGLDTGDSLGRASENLKNV